MGGGAGSKQKETSKTPEKTIAWATTSPEYRALEEEVRWHRLKVEQEKREKEWLMVRAGNQAFSCSGALPKDLLGEIAVSSARPPEEDLAWLRQAFDAEKTEKAWLMKRFEALETNLKARTEECTALRAEIIAREAGRPGSREAPGQPLVSQPTPSSGSLHSPGLPGSPPAVMDPYSPGASSTPGPAASTNQLSPKPLSLKERRGMKLSVETKAAGATAAASPAVAVEAAPAAAAAPGAVSEAPAASAPQSRAETFLRELDAAPAYSSEPMTALPAGRRSTFSAKNVEPASPLLLRRSMSMAKETPRSALSVTAFKMAALDFDNPASPKRVRGGQRVSFDDGALAARADADLRPLVTKCVSSPCFASGGRPSLESLAEETTPVQSPGSPPAPSAVKA